MTFALMPALVFSVSGLGLRGGSLSRAMLLWNVFVLLFMWRSYSQGLNLSSPPSVSDSPSQLEAFWTLSVISLGRLELFLLLVLFIVFNVHQNLGDAGNANKYFSLPSSFCLFFFLFCSPQLPVSSILPCADLWPFPPVCLSLPFWDISLLILPGENIIRS